MNKPNGDGSLSAVPVDWPTWILFLAQAAAADIPRARAIKDEGHRIWRIEDSPYPQPRITCVLRVRMSRTFVVNEIVDRVNTISLRSIT